MFALVYQVTVRTTRGRLVGDASLRGAIRADSRVSDAVDAALNVISLASLLGATAMIAVLALIRLRRSMGLAAIALLAGANLSARLLKSVVLSRPDLSLPEIAPATLNSLPSGHSTAALSVVAAMLFVVPARLRPATAAAGVVYASLTAVATMLAGWHRAEDSIAAFLLVGFWAAGVCVAVVILDGTAAEVRVVPGPAAQRRGRWPAVLAGCVLLTGLSVALVLGADEPLRDSRVGAVVAFLAGVLLIAGTAGAVLTAVRVAVDRVTPPPVIGARPAVVPKPA
jgi:membrane-associated phospholipid phosphatase